MSDYNAGHTDRLAAERRDIDAKWDGFPDIMARFRTMGAWSPPPMSLLGKELFLIGQPSPQELDAVAKMAKDLMAKLERSHKIDRLKAELRLKAEELRASEQEQALRDSPSEPLTNEELDVMLDKMNRDYMAAKLAEEGTEARAFPAKLNPHDE